jgi:hypothetical protein
MHTFFVILLKAIGTLLSFGIISVIFMSQMMGDERGDGFSKAELLAMIVLIAFAVGIWFL